MGELLRSACAKQIVNMALRMHQWSVSLPVACEAFLHCRGTIEPMVENGFLEPLVAADVDFVNMSGNAEWSRIRQPLPTHFPEVSAWTEWQHQSDSVTSFPTGGHFAINRGDEQGCVLGSVRSAAGPG